MIALDAAAQQRVGAVEFVQQRVLRQMFRRFQRRTGGEVIGASVEAEGKGGDAARDDVILRRFADTQRDVNAVLNQADAAVIHHHFQRHRRVLPQIIGEMRLLSRVPIDEPIAAYGPFVMNTREEIMEKIQDFNSGKFGGLH